MKGYFWILKEVYLHQLSYYNNLSQFLHKCFQLGDTKLSLRPYFQKTDFFLFSTCFSRTDSEQLEECFKQPGEVFVLDNLGYKNILQFHKRCHIWRDKGSAIFKDLNLKNRETCSLISRVCHQQLGDHVGGFIKFNIMEF